MGTASVTTTEGGDRYGALAGVVFVVLDVVVAVLGGEPLAVDAPVDEVVAHAVGFLTSGVLGSITASSVPSAVGLGAFVLGCVWILGVSREMWSGR